MGRIPTPHEELTRRAIAYVDRRGGALIRRGGRGGGGMGRATPKPPLVAITNFIPGNRFATPAGGGGEPGVTTGFCSVELIRVNTLQAASQIFGGRSGGADGGYFHTIDTTNGLRFYAKSDAGFPASPIRTLLASDVGKIFLVIGMHTGAAAQVKQFVDRAEVGTGTAAVGYVPEATPSIIGALVTASQPATGLSWLAAMAFRGTPTLAQLEQLYDLTRTLRDLPGKADAEAILVDSAVTHRWSLKDTLAGTTVVDGQPAPASLPDTVTFAAVDAMARQGSPIVRRIDPGVDGRQTFGAMGFSGTSYLESEPGKGIRGRAGTFVVRALVIFRSLSGIAYVAACASSSVNNGWSIQRNASTLKARVGGLESSRTLTATDLNVPHTVDIFFDGATSTLVFDGIAAPLSAAGAYIPPTESMTLGGRFTGGSFAAVTEDIFFLAGGDGGSIADLQAASTKYLQTGVFVASMGLANEHSYDLTADVIDNGGPENGIPAPVQDRIGTDHLTRVGGLRVIPGTPNGLTGFGPTGQLATANPGGIAGVGTGFFLAFDATLGVINQVKGIVARGDTTTKGYYCRVVGAGLQLIVCDSGGTPRALLLPLVASDATTRQRCIIHHTGSAIELYLGSPANVVTTPCSGFTPYVAAMIFGDLFINGGTANDLMVAYGLQGGHAVLTGPEIAALLADPSFSAIAAKTDRRWWFPSDIADAGGRAPTVIKERISGGDTMVTVGSGLQVAQRAERLWSYEAAPLLYGAA
jgi:hypothetical protein